MPLSDDIIVAKQLCAEYTTAGTIIKAFIRAMTQIKAPWPFSAHSALCSNHNTKYPIVQGPMAHVSDNPNFLAAVLEGGALPFLALSNMPAPIAAEGIELACDKTKGIFGVGLIGLEVNRKCYEAHLQLMKGNPPPFAILAAGNVDLAKQIETMGTKCYLHCPSPAILVEALKAGLRRFVFEGCESGGHIGVLGSLTLWNANLNELETHVQKGIPLDDVHILFAGGIGSERSAAFIAGMVADLVERGLRVGLQMGTAYLATNEAVSTCAITPTYQRLTLESEKTVVIGRTVNSRARAARSPMAQCLVNREVERLRSGISLTERKELYEKDNLGALRLASKGCEIDPSTATWDCPVFCEMPPDEQIERGLYLMGEVACLLAQPKSISELHEKMIEAGRKLFESQVTAPPPLEVTPAHPSQIDDRTEAVYEEELIAVVGIGLRFPGSDSPQTYWEQIITGRSGIIPVPKERWGNPELYYDPDPKAPDKTYSLIGGFLTDFIFDPLKFMIPPTVAQKMDRTQQYAVVCTADALADAGISPEELKGKSVGIIIGSSLMAESTELYAERINLPKTLARLNDTLSIFNFDSNAKKTLIDTFRSRSLEELPEVTEDSLPGELANIIAGRVANVFNLEGPCFTVDAACASTLAAVMNSVAALRQGKIDWAITGGADAYMHPSGFVKFCKLGALSPDGSRPFDESANGFIMGEGAGILILKRLSDAVHDGDKIYATILEIGSSSDGRGKGITAPNASGQERAIQACYETSGIDPASVSLIEAHGTATSVGDKTELLVLDRFFTKAGAAKQSVGLGSVKSQIGHLKPAAGAAGLIKASLSLFHRILPPTTNVQRPNSCIDWESSPLFLITESKPWDSRNEQPRRAGVSSFGFGGTNFHVLLQEYSSENHSHSIRTQDKLPSTRSVSKWPAPPDMSIEGEAWVIGADDDTDMVNKVKDIISGLNDKTILRLAHQHRSQAQLFPLRCGFAATNGEETRRKLELVVQGFTDRAKRSFFKALGIHTTQPASDRSVKGLAFLFPGQGSQYPFMLRDIAQRFSVVAETFEEADSVLSFLDLPTATSLVFPASSDQSRDPADPGNLLKDTRYLQPIMLTCDVAMLRLLIHFGVTPSACAGHSLGEYAACVAGGVLTFRDALEVTAARGREMAGVSVADPGLMMSVPADTPVVEEVLAQVQGYVVAANKNSPKQTVISGETEAVMQAAQLFKDRGLEGVLLPVFAAFHSRIVAPARKPFMQTLEKLSMKATEIPVVSNVTGDFYPEGSDVSQQIRELLGRQFSSPVQWVNTLRRLYADGFRLFVECGPKQVLTNLTRDTLPSDALTMPSNHAKKNGVVQFMETLAALAVEGIVVDFDVTEIIGKVTGRQRRVTHSAAEKKSQAQQPSRSTQAILSVHVDHPLEGLLDPDVRDISSHEYFARFLEVQGPIISGLIKSSFQSFLSNFVPLEKMARQAMSGGSDIGVVAVSGAVAGIPRDDRFPFDQENVNDLISGKNFIKRLPVSLQEMILDKKIERIMKGPSGESDFQSVNDLSEVIKLGGFFSGRTVIEDYGLNKRLLDAMDITSQLALAAGIEALRDAGIPLVRTVRKTSTGKQLPDSWALPEPLRRETGIIFASVYPGMASLVEEITKQLKWQHGAQARSKVQEFFERLLGSVPEEQQTDELRHLVHRGIKDLDRLWPTESYRFNRDFCLKVISMAHAQMAQLIRAQGPNTHVNAACAGTTQAIVLGRDWIRSGKANRVLIIAADDAANETLLPWLGSGYLAMGNVTTAGDVREAALPFDDRRHGMIIGSGAVGIVLERHDIVTDRGMEPIATIEAGIVANSGYHITRMDTDHIASVMEEMIRQWEAQTGCSRQELARKVFFMSHEPYTPKRGGSSQSEIRALAHVFGTGAHQIPITNTKGFTGHTQGVGIEDVVAVKCLQKQVLPPIPNLKEPDPEFQKFNLSKGGPVQTDYALRLAAGFGSQVVMALYKFACRHEDRLTNPATYRRWLREVTGYVSPEVIIENRGLRVIEKAPGSEFRPVPSSLSEVRPPVDQSSQVQFGNEDYVKSTIVRLLSEQTGYPIDMLDPNLDLETDLGIDTVKQAEFIAETKELLGISSEVRMKITEFPTIGHIVNFVCRHTGQLSQLPFTTDHFQDLETAQERDRVSIDPVSDSAGVALYEARLVDLPALAPIDPPQVDTIFLTGGSHELTSALDERLSSIGYSNIERLTHPSLPADCGDRRIGIINLFPSGSDETALRRTFELYLSCAAVFEHGPSFLITLVSEDGALGFRHAESTGVWAGCMAGATKAFAREFRECLTRIVDVHPSVYACDYFSAVKRCLNEDMPTETALDETGTLRVLRFVPSVSVDQGEGIRGGDVILVTGGARGITSACLTKLAQRYPLTIVIFGRTVTSERSEAFSLFDAARWENEKMAIVNRIKESGGSPTPSMVDKEIARLKAEAETFTNLDELREFAVELVYKAVDVTDSSEVDLAVKEVKDKYERVDLVLHGAGIDQSKALRTKTLAEMESVVAVKVLGMQNLMTSFAKCGISPRRIVGFGSVSGRFGNVAQVDYSAANDGLAHLLRHIDQNAGLKASIIDWAPWSEIGMATKETVQRTLRSAGIDFISPEVGAEMLISDLNRLSDTPEVLAAGGLGPFFPDAFTVPGGSCQSSTLFAGQHGVIQSMLPREHLRARVTLDASHWVLAHHRVDGVPIFPGVAGIEAMRNAINCVTASGTVAAIQDVHFHMPIKMKRDQLDLFLEILKETDLAGELSVYKSTISSFFLDTNGNKVGQPRLHHEGRVAIGFREPAMFRHQERWNQTIRVNNEDIYSIFFHGPAFRFLDHIVFSPNYKKARFRCQNPVGQGCSFAVSIPRTMEAFFQACAGIALESRGVLTLVKGFKKATIYQSEDVAFDGETILTSETACCGSEERLELRFDGLVRNRKGQVIIEFEGVEMIELDRCHGFRGKVFEEVVAVTDVNQALKEMGQSYLQEWLCPEELAEYESKAVPKRAGEWLAGRVAVKRCVQRIMEISGGSHLSGRDFKVSQNASRKPVIEFLEKSPTMDLVSLSHSSGMAIAMVCSDEPFVGIGIDMELVGPRSEAWVNDCFSEKEIILAGTGPQRWKKLTAMWSVKEAALKALGVGLALDVREITVRSLSDWGDAVLALEGKAYDLLTQIGGKRLQAQVEQHQEVMVARAVIRRNDA